MAEAAQGGVDGSTVGQPACGNTFVSGDVDGNDAADFRIRLDGLVPLTASDFIM